MKKLIASITAAALLATMAYADEGMWLLPLLEKMNSEAIYKLGGHLSAEDIYSINHSSIKDAVVQFGGGCTGEIISDRGLLVTNHHCGFSTIQKLSSPEHNYLEDGFFAKSGEEEIPAPGLTVTFLQSMTDVTAKMPQKKEEILEKARKDNPHCTVQIVSFYNDNVFYLIVYKTYRDVRFVGAPPVSSGKFGGETDNWMWPRHTCDFSMFRVYAGADNEPAEYSPENVPFKPRRSLSISLKGYEEGDFAMIMGYPGSTQRFQTAAQLSDMVETNNIRIAARTVRQNVLWEERMADPVVNLQYANKYASSSNAWKKWQGMRESFDKLGIIAREKEKEASFKEWVDSRNSRKKDYGTAIEDINSVVALQSHDKRNAHLLTESIGTIELLSIAGSMAGSLQLIRENMPQDARNQVMEVGFQTIIPRYKDYSGKVDRKVAAAVLKFYRDNVKPEDALVIPGYDIFTMDIDAYVDELFDRSVYSSEEKVTARNLTVKDYVEDPAAVLYNSFMNKLNQFRDGAKVDSDKLAAAGKAYTAGQLEWKKGQPSYPDANFTCRLTYGNIMGYEPKDGVIYKHYTTLKGVMEKEDPENYEFRVPARLKEIYETGDYGQYANKDGELVTCFLTNLDITGGNSGSPVMDADGNLIGLAFDGNWEAMSSDVLFEPELQRCICVDIRYVLLMMDKFGGAGYLLNEMNLVK